MAKSPQGVNAITVWMIIFVALWLTATVFLVVLYTGQEELRGENTRLTEDNRRLISSNERSSLALVQDARPEGPTVVGLIESERMQTADLATGTAADDAATVQTKRDQILDSITGDALVAQPRDYQDVSLLAALTKLYEEFKKENTLRKDAYEQVEALAAEVKQLAELNAAQKDDFDKRAEALAAELAEAEAGRTGYRTERDAAVARITQDFEKQISETDAALTRERQRLAALERDKNELQKRYLAQQERFGESAGGAGDLSTAREPDGRILTAIPGDDLVYIDLGSKHRLLLGMRFSVYPALTGIPADGRAKAQIEVVSVGPTSAECRILRVGRDEIIVEGDLVASPVYDRDRPLAFITIGEFDLDHDGRSDPDGVATVESMITAWGGTITRELTALTDFAVLGAPPRKPRTNADLTGEAAERNQALQDRWEEYQQSLASARNLAVPILPQEVFLNFLGYGGLTSR